MGWSVFTFYTIILYTAVAVDVGPTPADLRRTLIESGVYAARGGVACGAVQCDLSRGEFCHRGLGECQPCSGYCGPDHEHVPSDSCLDKCQVWLVEETFKELYETRRLNQADSSTSLFPPSTREPADSSCSSGTGEWSLHIAGLLLLMALLGGNVYVIVYLMTGRQHHAQVAANSKDVELSVMASCRTRTPHDPICDRNRATAEMQPLYELTDKSHREGATAGPGGTPGLCRSHASSIPKSENVTENLHQQEPSPFDPHMSVPVGEYQHQRSKTHRAWQSSSRQSGPATGLARQQIPLINTAVKSLQQQNGRHNVIETPETPGDSAWASQSSSIVSCPQPTTC